MLMKPGSRKYGELLGVTGNPIFPSKSPFMFNSLFQAMRINKFLHYIKIAANTPEEAMFLFKELDLMGMNVTAPFKNSIMAHLDKVDRTAVKIGGVNTVVRGENNIKGYNTDHFGVTEALKTAGRGINLKGKKCLVLGAGGAGRAAVYGLLKEKAIVILVNRTYSKAIQAAKDFGCGAQEISSLQNLLKETDILVSTLPAAADIIPAEWLRKGLVVLDANYKKTSLCIKAKERECMVVRGEEWLLHQARPAYEYFMGAPPKEPGYFEVVKHFLLAMLPTPPPQNIALVGFMGCGKSYIGKMLAEKLGLVFKDGDELLEKATGFSIPEIFRKYREEVFRGWENMVLMRELTLDKGVVYACGGGVVLEPENLRILKDNSLVIWLYSSIPTSLKRIPKGTRPLLDCEVPEIDAQRILNERLFRYGQAADLVVSSEGEASQVVEKIIDEIGQLFKH